MFTPLSSKIYLLILTNVACNKRPDCILLKPPRGNFIDYIEQNFHTMFCCTTSMFRFTVRLGWSHTVSTNTSSTLQQFNFLDSSEWFHLTRVFTQELPPVQTLPVLYINEQRHTR